MTQVQVEVLGIDPQQAGEAPVQGFRGRVSGIPQPGK